MLLINVYFTIKLTLRILLPKENITDQAVLVQKLVAQDPTEGANYGESVSISDNKILVGAPNDVVVSSILCRYILCFGQLRQLTNTQNLLPLLQSTNRYGSAYFYYLNDETWTILEKLEPGTQIRTPGAMFGQSVSISSSAMVTGVPNADISVDNSGSIFINNIINHK